MHSLTTDEKDIVNLVAEFVDRDVKPRTRDLEHANEYPADLIEKMKALGIFGLTIPQTYGGVGTSAVCYALVTEELARGWMSLAGAVGGHTVVSKLIHLFGDDDQKKLLPRLATGELRATMALTEPDGGSDLQAMRTVARRTGENYVINGSKTWISNARHSDIIALLCKTDPDAEPAYRGMSILLVEQNTPGFNISRDLPKLGYKGIESCELSFADANVPSTALLGVREGQGFSQMMKGLEIGRIQVAARAVGVARAALEDSIEYAAQRKSFGKPIWKHQSIGNYLANMATKVTASRLMVLDAAMRLDSGERCDLEAGMAKLFASEAAMECALDAMRIHGGYGYSTEYDIERYFRDAPLMIVGEGTNEIQRNVIVQQLMKRRGLA